MSIEVKTDKKEYPQLTFEQVKLLAKLRNEGKTEAEAMAIVLKN